MTEEAPAQELLLHAKTWLWPAVAVLVLGAWLSWRAGHRLPGSWRTVSVGLRVAGFALLLLCLLEPVLRSRKPKAGANFLAIVSDNSTSLAIEDADRPDRRIEEDRRILAAGKAPEDEPDWLAELGENYRIRRYLFGARLEGVKDFTDLDASEPASALGTALRRVGEQFEERPLAGVLLLTDGNATDVLPEPEILAALPPVYPVLLGGIGPKRDRALGDVVVEQTVFEDAPVTIDATASGFGVEESGTVIALFDPEGQEVERRTVTLPAGGEPEKIRFRVKPAAAGIHFYELRILGDDESEATLENNRRTVVVDRARGPYRILYLSWRPNWEYKFLRRSCEEDEELDLVGLVRVARREPKFEWTGRARGSSANPLFQGFGGDGEEQRYDQPVLTRLQISDPTELAGGFPKLPEKLFAPYQAIIVDDLESEFFTADQLVLLRDFVSRRGGGFLMLGGGDSLGQGGYEDTPVGDLLPVFTKPGREEPGALRYSLSREGWLEPWVRLRDTEGEERDRLAAMPVFRVHNPSRALKPGGSVLATVLNKEKKALPALVAQRYGKGRSAALLVGDVWRWGMKDPESRLDMEKSWRQILRWLVAEAPRRLELEPVKPTLGEPVALRARVSTRTFKPDLEATVGFEVWTPGGTEPLAVLPAGASLEEPGLYEAEFHPDEPAGSYRVVAKALDKEGEIVPEREAGWAFHPAAEEYADLVPNQGILETIASATGGRLIGQRDLDDLIDALGKEKAPIEEVVVKPLWNMPWVFALALACLLGEWWIRRMKGMP